MAKGMNNKFWGFAGRLVLIHALTYTVVAVAFVQLQQVLPAPWRTALDFFEPYSASLTGIAEQIIIAAVLALVLYPFYDILVKGKNSLLILFAALWGIVLLGSLEPKPGTIEGMLYTVTSTFEHLLVLTAGAAQVLLFAWLFLRWERTAAATGEDEVTAATEPPGHATDTGKMIRGYVKRYTVLHVLVYILIGIVFYQVSGYEEALATMEYFELWRPLENTVMPVVILLGQIMRGGILALLLYPFYHIFMQRKHGWLLLFGLLFGLKVLATVISIPETTELFIQGLAEMKTGIPEITAQTLLFSWLFFFWERKKYNKSRQLKERPM